MRSLLAILTLTLAPLVCAADSAPDFAAVTADGNAITLADEVRDHHTVLFFWASWCPYCKALMPHLQSIRLEYGDEVRIIALHFRDDADGAAFIREAGYDFTVVPDADAIAERYGVHGTPGVIIPDRELAIRFDLRTLARRAVPGGDDQPHSAKAAFRAPYWAAEIRRALDELGER
jgi:thiol-disulfide isomerase/thioredoxin